MLLNPGQEGYKNTISANQCSTSGFKAALAALHVFFHLCL